MKSSPTLVIKKSYLFDYAVDRETRCFLGWKVTWERTQELIQASVDHAPKAQWHFSDVFDVYASLWYHWRRYEVSEGKSDTYSVEGNNAELRHYLAPWLAPLAVFHIAHMSYTVQSDCLSITSTSLN